MTLGERIRSARKLKRMTQRELASKIGAAHNSVSDWENNKNKPDPDTIELICGILDITPNYILGSSEDALSPSEKALINKYRALDSHGKEAVDTILQLEYDRVTAANDYLYPLAAHNRTDIDGAVEQDPRDVSTLKDHDF